MSQPSPDAGSPKDRDAEGVHWSVCRASEEIDGEIVLSRLIKVRIGPQTLNGTNALSIQLYEMQTGTRWIRLWNDPDRAMPYEEFVRALRMAASDLGWTDNDDAEHP